MPHPTLDRARTHAAELTAIRRDIHAHPEIGMNEHRTAELVARNGGIRRSGGPNIGIDSIRGGAPGGGLAGTRGRGPEVPGGGTPGLASASGASAADGVSGDVRNLKYSVGRHDNVARLLHEAIGGTGRGALFHVRPTPGTDAPVRIVYAMDISLSMRDGNKILKATEALHHHQQKHVPAGERFC